MKVAVLHNPVAPGAPPEELDNKIQCETVNRALVELGHRPEPVPFGSDLTEISRALERVKPACVFNLVESVGIHERLIYFAPAFLEALGIPFTGVPSIPMMLTTNKLIAKKIMRREGLPTPDWWVGDEPFARLPQPGERVMFKSLWEHGSMLISDDSVARVEEEKSFRERLKKLSENKSGRTFFAEQFIEGREINVALLAGPRGPEALPPTEIQFVGYGPERLKIVGYQAKWDSGSYEFKNTVSSFDFSPEDQPIIEKLKKISLSAWEVFGLRGFARVDFRLDSEKRPWILEVNANPCLSPDAGFVAALHRAGITFAEAIERLLQDALGTSTPGNNAA
ncbi:MAG: D-alanine--D-alanine ligase [bacterium]|nr:D-alanine--D-alanine ligase [bacterium]